MSDCWRGETQHQLSAFGIVLLRKAKLAIWKGASLWRVAEQAGLRSHLYKEFGCGRLLTPIILEVH